MPYYALLGRPCHLGAGMPAHVVVPEGTALHRMTADEVLIGPEVTPVRDQMEHTWSHGGAVVLPNLALAAVLEGWDERDLQFDGYELVLPGTGRHGDPVHLCTDTEGACPADVEQVRAGRKHTCDGILGLYRAETLEWMECPTVTVVTHATLRHLPLLLSAEAVLGKALRDRTEERLRLRLPVQAAESVLAVTRAYVASGPGRFRSEVERVIEECAAEGRVRSVEDVLRNELAESLALEAADPMRDLTRIVLDQQTRRLADGPLGGLPRLVREDVGRRGHPVDLIAAEDMLRSVLDGRLDGDRQDLVSEDLLLLDENLRPLREELRRGFPEDVVESLAAEYRRPSGP